MPVARRSLRVWAADNDLQPLQSLVSASRLAAHLREDGGRWPHSRRAFHRQQPRQSASLGERLKKGEFEEAIGRSRGGRTRKIHALADDRVALTPEAKILSSHFFPPSASAIRGALDL